MSKGHKLIGSYRSFTGNFSTGGIFDMPDVSQQRNSDSWDIITNGLIMNLDARNIQSYPGSGADWWSIGNVGGSVARVISNGTPSYNSQGFFSVNSDSQAFNIANYAAPTNSFTYEVWARPTATHEIDVESNGGAAGVFGQKYLIGAAQAGAVRGGAGISCGTNGVSVYEHGDGYMPPLLVWSGTVSNTLFSHIVVVYSNRIPTLYVNNVFRRTGLVSGRPTSTAEGTTIGYGSYGFFTGDIAAVRFYNRSLSVNEIAQNFNALRGRYGV